VQGHGTAVTGSPRGPATGTSCPSTPRCSSPGTPRAASTLTGTFGSIKRPDGSRQLTYNGKPLYTFRLDDAPGQAHGNNFTDQFGGQTFRWHAATASGSTPAPSQPGSPSGYNYSYQGGSGGY
jgi:Secreted repeat of unknown function